MKAKTLIPPVVFALLLGLVTFFILDRYVVGVSLPGFALFRQRRSAAFTVAEEIGDLYLLNTSEYRMKLLFPYDFVDRDLNWWYIKEMYERGIEADEQLEELVRIYETCLHSGFDPAIEAYEFIVLTAVVKAGINISGTVFENPALYGPNGMDDYMRIEEGEKGKRITLRIPDTEVTDLYIDDRRPGSDNFPDAEMTPSQWRDLVNFLDPYIREKVIELGILDDASLNSRILLEKILKDSGFAEVYFTERKL